MPPSCTLGSARFTPLTECKPVRGGREGRTDIGAGHESCNILEEEFKLETGGIERGINKLTRGGIGESKRGIGESKK